MGFRLREQGAEKSEMWESRFQRSDEVHHEMGDRPLCKSTEETFELSGRCRELHEDTADRRSGPLER